MARLAMAFFINVPLAIAELAASPVLLRKGTRPAGRLDLAGALLGTAALVAVYPSSGRRAAALGKWPCSLASQP